LHDPGLDLGSGHHPHNLSSIEAATHGVLLLFRLKQENITSHHGAYHVIVKLDGRDDVGKKGKVHVLPRK
jgi:hypothetical protein